MNKLEMLQRYEETERLGQSIVPHEGDPWSGDNTFAAFQERMHRQIAVAFGLTPTHQGRKTCLSCGAIQTLTGDLPCGH
jgi:hypothetical protein